MARVMLGPTDSGGSRADAGHRAWPGAEPLVDLVVPDALVGDRVDRVVAMLASCSRAQASDLISAGSVIVNGTQVHKSSQKLLPGDRLILTESPEFGPTEVGPDSDVVFGVAFEDEHLVVIDKPAGLVVHPGAGNPSGTLVNGLVHRYPTIAEVGDASRPGIVHRLDSGTSGLMVVAKTQDAYVELVDQLAARLVHRTYTALVQGHFEHARGVIDAPVGRSRRDPLRMTVSVDGKDARTHYEVDEQFSQPTSLSLVTCRLETGRTHQIRVHLSSIGHPVVGDERYGAARGRFNLDRPFLHARELGFLHPITGEDIACSSDLPADLAEVLSGVS